MILSPLISMASVLPLCHHLTLIGSLRKASYSDTLDCKKEKRNGVCADLILNPLHSMARVLPLCHQLTLAGNAKKAPYRTTR